MARLYSSSLSFAAMAAQMEGVCCGEESRRLAQRCARGGSLSQVADGRMDVKVRMALWSKE